MILKDISFKTPEENILFDEVLLKLAEEGQSPGYLRFWESPQTFVVLGRICKEDEDLNKDAIKGDNISVVRRASGGGTVLQGSGCLNFSVILPKRHNRLLDDINKSYEYILTKVVVSLEVLGVETQFFPICDIALTKNQKKVSGNAQKRGKYFILHHGTLLYNFDLDLISKYLQLPKDMPEYRQNRSHNDFIDNISIENIESIKEVLAHAFNAGDKEDITDDELDYLSNFKKEKDIAIVL